MPADNTFFRLNRINLIALGIWNETSGLYQIYRRCVHVFFATAVVTLWVRFFLIPGNNVDELLENAGISLLYTVTLFKMLTCMSRTSRSLVAQVESFEREELPKETDPEFNRIYQRCVFYNNVTHVFFTALGFVTIIPFFWYPFIRMKEAGDELEEKPLPFSGWLPFDRNEHYTMAFSLHVVAGLYGCQYVSSSDSFFYGLMIFCAGQCKLLQYRFRNLDGDDCGVLRALIEHHKRIIKFTDDLNKLMNILMLLDFFTCSLQMAVLAFQFLIVDFSIKQLFVLEYLFAMLLQMLWFYWHANEIMLESQNIALSIWESKWYERSIDVQKMLQFVMVRSQKPLKLYVGPFYVMSTQTAITILKATFSYITLLRQTYDRN